MKPSKEAIDKAFNVYVEKDHSGFRYISTRAMVEAVVAAAYAIDVAPLEQRIRELEEAENICLQVHNHDLAEIERLKKWETDHYKVLCDYYDLRDAQKELEAERDDHERWMQEVLADFKIPFDDHEIGRRVALTQWMVDLEAERDRLKEENERLELEVLKKQVFENPMSIVSKKHGDMTIGEICQLNCHLAERLATAEGLLEECWNVFPLVAQLLDGWHMDGTAWSGWDESVRQQVSAIQGKVDAYRKYTEAKEQK